jgi:5,10-methylenetetrahydromethanopterin reductase
MSTSIILSGNGEVDSRKVAGISSKTEMKGFDGLWFGETTVNDASVLASVAACVTEKIQLGTSIVNVFTRTPGQLAIMGATISQLSNGRFTLGLGVSSAPIVENWHGLRFDKPVQRLDETVRVLRHYFSGERFSHRGTYCSPTNAILRTKPCPKIALAALNERMIKKAAGLADKVILNLYPTERIAHAVDLVEEGCRAAGKKEKPPLSVMLYAHVLGHDEKGLEAARDLVAFYASSPAYSALFSSIGFKTEAKAMLEAWRTRNRESVRRIVTPQMIDRIMVLGTLHDLRERVKLYHESGVDDVLIAPSPFRDFEANVNEVLDSYF